MNWRQVVVAAVILGAVAGLVVMWLERFEVEKMHTEIRGYLDRVDRFRAWEAEHGDSGA